MTCAQCWNVSLRTCHLLLDHARRVNAAMACRWRAYFTSGSSAVYLFLYRRANLPR